MEEALDLSFDRLLMMMTGDNDRLDYLHADHYLLTVQNYISISFAYTYSAIQKPYLNTLRITLYLHHMRLVT